MQTMKFDSKNTLHYTNTQFQHFVHNILKITMTKDAYTVIHYTTEMIAYHNTLPSFSKII